MAPAVAAFSARDTLNTVRATSAQTAVAAASSSAAFRWPLRVYIEDTDAGGVVYYATYLNFFERCRTEWLRALGVDQSTLARRDGLQFVVAEVEVKYLQPARLDDELAIEARVTHAGRCSIVFDQAALRAGEVIARARITVACVDAQGVPARLPEALRLRILPAAAPSSPPPRSPA